MFRRDNIFHRVDSYHRWNILSGTMRNYFIVELIVRLDFRLVGAFFFFLV